MEDVTMLVFEGTGYGFMQGITRYIVFTTTPDEDDAREPAPGFDLVEEHECMMPLSAVTQVEGDTLIVRA